MSEHPVTELKYEPPKRTVGDIAHALVKGAIGSVPPVGGFAAEVFGIVIAPPLDKRRSDWMDQIGEGLRALEGKVEGFRIEELSSNDAFISIVMHASQAAVRNHQTEKREALRNAVLNVAIGNAPEDDLQLMFLNWVDSFTTWHLRILRLFQTPVEHGKKVGFSPDQISYVGSPSDLLERCYSDLQGKRVIYDQIVSELHSRGLLGIDSLHSGMTGQGVFAKRTIELGDQFLNFITSPI